MTLPRAVIRRLRTAPETVSVSLSCRCSREPPETLCGFLGSVGTAHGHRRYVLPLAFLTLADMVCPCRDEVGIFKVAKTERNIQVVGLQLRQSILPIGVANWIDTIQHSKNPHSSMAHIRIVDMPGRRDSYLLTYEAVCGLACRSSGCASVHVSKN
jgi:hypothetical protein